MSTRKAISVPSPIVKWVGGKTKLLDQLVPLLPEDVRSRRYVEPFVGGGALFFRLRPTNALLCDVNESLINLYRVVRDNVNTLIVYLKELEKQHSVDFYYEMRAQYNLYVALRQCSPEELAALFLYLNKTCFNGLYRVNKSGAFNVPAGKYKNPGILNEPALRMDSKQLKCARLCAEGFEKLLVSARADDFIYFDPPYAPLSSTSNFTSYSSEGFSQQTQSMLRDVFLELDRLGCKLMLSNSDTPLIRDLYRNFNISQVFAPRRINCKGDNRGNVSELVVRNYT